MVWHFDGWWMGFGMLLWPLLLAAIIGLVVWLAVRGGRPAHQSVDEAEQILRRRFAAGEIDEEEYRRRIDALRQ
jgi:putative membrane protein